MKIQFIQKFEIFFGFVCSFIYLSFIIISVYKANITECIRKWTCSSYFHRCGKVFVLGFRIYMVRHYGDLILEVNSALYADKPVQLGLIRIYTICHSSSCL